MEGRCGLGKELRLGWGPSVGTPPGPAKRESRWRRSPPEPLQQAITCSPLLQTRSRDSSALSPDDSWSLAMRVRDPAGVAKATVRPRRSGPGPSAQSRSLPRPAPPRPQGSGRAAMTTRRAGRASRCPEMEEKELLRRQIRLLQGLIDDYKNLHGNAPAPGTSATSRWQPPSYSSSRTFGARYPRPSRRGFSPSHGPAWRKKYSLVNHPPASLDLPGDGAAQPTVRAGSGQDPEPQQHVLERQVQLSSDQSMVIKIKPPSKAGLASIAGASRGSSEEYEGPPWNNPRPREGEGEPPGGQQQPSKPGGAKGTCSPEDPLLVCQKEAGKPRVVKSVSSLSDSLSESRRTVSESALSVKARLLASTQSPRSGTALARKAGSLPVARSAAQLLGDGRVDAGHPDQPAPSGSVAGSARLASGPRQAREASLLVSCRTKFRKSNYKWVAASAKSPRAPRRALSPRVAAENTCVASCGAAERVDKLQSRVDLDAKPRKSATPSKYKWKAASPSASSSSFRWQSEVGSKDRASQLSPVPSRSPPGDKPAVGPSGSKPLFSETTGLSAYKVKSRTKIVKRRGSANLPGDKKGSPPPVATAKSQFSLRRRQTHRGKSGPLQKKTPTKGLTQVTRQRLCSPPAGGAHTPTKEAVRLSSLRSPPTSKVIQTRYRIVKKTPVSPLNVVPFPLSLPSWRTRRLSLSRSLTLSRLRHARGGGRARPGPPRWRDRGFRCIGGVLYRVSANKLSRTGGRPSSEGGGRPLLRAGRSDPTGSCSRSLASRAVQRSLAIVRQARQRQRRTGQEYCMYYNRFGRCGRGEHCPYIHDPEKVAVCTRFVRGTCKKTDGTCPFSHQVSKEKMPVCSYFLKGICSNSNCPYSHVYVSRKAEVCTDFLRGYCPLGAKCKKKHTLLCPDFSREGTCPRGAQCQLLHRTQKRLGRRAAASPAPGPSDTPSRSRASASHGSRKSSATQHPSRPTSSRPTSVAARLAPPPSSTRVLTAASARPLSSKAPSSPSRSPSPLCVPSPSPSPSLDQGEPSLQEAATSARTGAGSLSQLPAFISLQSSPSPGGQPRAPGSRSPPTRDSGKPLHIKPRL
ncbi:zinc finger CCCH domain-containing protein 3 isoform X2 [Sturnira hondurensis]|uniref:zinc finger CCCH domain-containing protein 3 isoform X2 n=1 Tax=Sturnira hondurensis TaxID=192404 RepID=UPI00187AC2B4|nr:zinc finger CCCH domain-containing protein 3 isoform X2 [Sturnira hondurensis]